MKSIFNYLGLLLVFLLVISCEPESEVAVTSYDNLSTANLELDMPGATKITFDEEINDFMAGDIVSELYCADGQGPIAVEGLNPAFPTENAAMIFDSSNPSGGDVDLGTPNSFYGGPGISVNGDEISNNVELFNVLIVSEDLDSSDPDDAAVKGAGLWLDFSALGSVTLYAMDLLDVDGESNGAFVELLDGSDNVLLTVNLPETGDNGLALIDLGPTAGVVKMHVKLNGSGAIDNICLKKEDDGCTHTLGYWKTHAKQGPAGYDDTWDLIGPLGENETFFLSGGTYFDAINASAGGNAYYQLSQQYIAAVLSVLDGASSADIASELAEAKTLFETYTPAQIGALRGNDATRKSFISLSETLDSYNNGIIGPGHCDDQEESKAD